MAVVAAVAPEPDLELDLGLDLDLGLELVQDLAVLMQVVVLAHTVVAMEAMAAQAAVPEAGLHQEVPHQAVRLHHLEVEEGQV